MLAPLKQTTMLTLCADDQGNFHPEVHPTGVYFMGVYLTGVHLMGVYLMNVHLTGMQDTIHSMQIETLNLYVGNMPVETIYQRQDRNLPPGAGNDPSHSTTRHAQAAQHIEPKNLKDLGIPLKYHAALQKFPMVCDPRVGP
jgi:hypothetical protein